jgi:hypothetical protein
MPDERPSETVREVVGAGLARLRAEHAGEGLTQVGIGRATAQVERLTGITGADLQTGMALAVEYYRGAAAARAVLDMVPVEGLPIAQAAIASFLPGRINPNTTVSARVYFEYEIAPDIWGSVSVVVNVRAGAGIQDILDATTAAAIAGEISVLRGEYHVTTTQNATVLSIAGYARNTGINLVVR